MPANPDGRLFRSLLLSADEEARRRGDRRIGTEHLLLGLLHEAGSPATTALGVSLADVRRVAGQLDLAALAAVGVTVESLEPAVNVTPGRRLLPVTSGARAALKRAFDSAGPRRRRRVNSAHFLLALLALPRPDRAAALLDAVDVDRAAITERIGGSLKGVRV